jgi:hypothetical protein
MPVSKKRKKSGKPVQRAAPSRPSDAPEEQGEAKQASHPQQRMGKPSNPFVAQHQTPRGAQRGR